MGSESERVAFGSPFFLVRHLVKGHRFGIIAGIERASGLALKNPSSTEPSVLRT